MDPNKIYRIPNTGGMKFICNRWVFTGGGDYYKVEQREDGDWGLGRYLGTGVFDRGVYPTEKLTEEGAHALAARRTAPKSTP